MQNYGIFTLAVTASSALVTISTPMGQTLLPRLTLLNAQGKWDEALKLYRNGTQLAVVVALSAALVLTLFSKEILWIWTGDWIVAGRAAPILSAYAIGSGVVPLTAFTYYLQYSRGGLRLHMIGQILITALFVPGVLFTAHWFGAIGVGYLWTVLNITYLLVWTALVHQKLTPGLHWSWFLGDIGSIFIPAAIFAAVLDLAWKWPDDRLTALTELILVSFLVLATAVAASSFLRGWVRMEARKFLHGGAGL